MNIFMIIVAISTTVILVVNICDYIFIEGGGRGGGGYGGGGAGGYEGGRGGGRGRGGFQARNKHDHFVDYLWIFRMNMMVWC